MIAPVSDACLHVPHSAGSAYVVMPTSGVCPADTGTDTYFGVTAGAFDIDSFETFTVADAQTLVTLTLVAFAVAYAFRMLRDMILNRR